MMSKAISLWVLLLSLQSTWIAAFTSPAVVSRTVTQQRINGASKSSSALNAADTVLKEGDPVMLIGPGLLQLVLAKHLKLAGFKPIVVAPQKKLDAFVKLILDDDIMKDSTIGMPEEGDPYFGEIQGVVFCAEDAILPSEYISRVLDFTDKGKSPFVDAALKRVICCLPVEGKVQKEKAASWIPIFNNDRTIEQNWKNFHAKFTSHPVWTSGDAVGTIIRMGSTFGGSYDGPEFLRAYGLDEGVYKMSLEQYRDLRERGFDRYKLGAQVLEGNKLNNRPPNQDKMEKEAFEGKKGELKEAFQILGGYPEIDRVNRHTLSQGIVQALTRPTDSIPREFTILSKAVSEFPTAAEWDELFANPQPAKWPDPFTFVPGAYGIEEQV